MALPMTSSEAPLEYTFAVSHYHNLERILVVILRWRYMGTAIPCSSPDRTLPLAGVMTRLSY